MSTSTPLPFDKTLCIPAYLPAGGVDETALDRASEWLEKGWPVVVPSETVYGLAAIAADANAVQRIFQAKGRPADNPLIVHVANLAQARSLAATPSPLAQSLAQEFWPGPLTLVLDCEPSLPWVTAGLDSIALRQPNCSFFAALIARVGPLAAPSANRSGSPSPTLALHALDDLRGKVPLVIDGGPVQHGLESTVVDARGTRPRILRPGAVTEEHLAVFQPLTKQSDSAHAPRSPGLKYRHYSPRAEIWLYPHEGFDSPAQRHSLMSNDAKSLRAQGFSAATLCEVPLFESTLLTRPEEPSHYAHHLFDWLRQFDEQAFDYILAEAPSSEGLGRAVVDRLTRAAQHTRLPNCELPKPPDSDRGTI